MLINACSINIHYTGGMALTASTKNTAPIAPHVGNLLLTFISTAAHIRKKHEVEFPNSVITS